MDDTHDGSIFDAVVTALMDRGASCWMTSDVLAYLASQEAWDCHFGPMLDDLEEQLRPLTALELIDELRGRAVIDLPGPDEWLCVERDDLDRIRDAIQREAKS